MTATETPSDDFDDKARRVLRVIGGLLDSQISHMEYLESRGYSPTDPTALPLLRRARELRDQDGRADS